MHRGITSMRARTGASCRAGPWTRNSTRSPIASASRGIPVPPIADYHTVDLTLRSNNESGDWGYSFKVLNLFGADAREPSRPDAVA